jgi:ParB family transcriptional regulator, chromosome partitioning protein
VPYSRTANMEQRPRTPVDLPEADQAEYDRLSDMANENEDLTEEDIARIDELEDRMRGDWSDEVRAECGVFVYVDFHGKLQVAGAYRKVERHAGTGDDKVEVSGGGEKPLIPQNCLDDLSRIRLAAQQTTMLTQHEQLLDLLAYQLEVNGSIWTGALGVSVDRGTIRPEKDEHFHQDERLPDDGPDYSRSPTWSDFEAFQAKGKKHRNEVLTRHLARSLRGFNTSGFLKEIFTHTGAGATIRKIWHPSAANFFGRVRPDYLDRLWAELLELEGDDERLADFCKMKKAEKARELEALFHNAETQEALGLSRDQVKRIDAWVPAEMWDGGEAGA